MTRNERIKKALTSSGVTQSKLAEVLGVTHAAVSERLSGEKEIDSIEFIDTVCRITGRGWGWFIHGDDSKLTPEQTRDYLIKELSVAEVKAWDSLSRYKFQMFGYWAAIWVHLNRISGLGLANPFKSIVDDARFVVGSLAAEQGKKEDING